MKEERKMKGWSRLAVVLLAMSFALPIATMTLPAPALANQEMHTGGRLFYPLWDVSGSRLTFIIITRLPVFNVDQPEDRSTNRLQGFHSGNNCIPGHTTAHPTGFGIVAGTTDTTDDVHLQWYGKTCDATNEWIPMSCGDIDLIFLDAATLPNHFTATADLQGALDVHFTINGNSGPEFRVEENSLLGHAVIVDPAGWAATYPAAAAKATLCNFCAGADGGTDVGYEPFPREVFLPFALVDDSQGGISNLLSLWAPSFFPGQAITPFHVQWNWYDGRERRFSASTGDHAIVQTLKSIDPLHFLSANFDCAHAAINEAENDGPPCPGPDAIHTSDNAPGVGKQTSSEIGWWIFQKDATVPDPPFPFFPGALAARGLVGVVLTSTGGVGDTTRLWHKDPCHLAPAQTVGPPHLRDWAFQSNPDYLVGFNLFTSANQLLLCNRTAPTTTPTDFTSYNP
jgi:hypothetical protein